MQVGSYPAEKHKLEKYIFKFCISQQSIKGLKYWEVFPHTHAIVYQGKEGRKKRVYVNLQNQMRIDDTFDSNKD